MNRWFQQTAETLHPTNCANNQIMRHHSVPYESHSPSNGKNILSKCQLWCGFVDRYGQ